MNVVFYTILVANLVSFLQMAIDKRLAIKQQFRIPEAQLIAPTLFGGFPGILLGMLLFRHKTKKRSFQLKLLFALALFIGVIYLLRNRFF